MMEYTRYSSQPATIDLVRADLAEIWTVDEPEFESPKRPPSISGLSDMLDLEFIPTPEFRPSKTPRKDPLPKLLGDVLELSPTRKRGRDNGDGKRGPDKPSDSGNDEIHCDTPSESYSSPRDTQKKLRPATHFEQPPVNGNKRGHAKQEAETAETIVDSPAPKSRRQCQSNPKPAAKPAARKRPAKGPKQAKTSIQTKKKATKPGDDLFELSDVTDTEEESKPKKRQAKQPSSKEPQASPEQKPRGFDQGDVQSVLVMNQGSKPTRVPKKPTSRKVPRENKSEAEPAYSNTIAHGGQEAELRIGSDQVGNKNASSRTKADSHENPQSALGQPIRKTDSPHKLTSPQPPKRSALVSRENTSVLPAVLKPLDVITVSSEGEEEYDAPAGSTSPLFTQQCPQDALSDDPDIAITVEPKIDSRQSLPIPSRVDHASFGFTPPPSLQPHALTKHTSMPQAPAAGHSLPPNLREAFLSDEQLANSPSLTPVPGSSSAEEGLRPEDIWKQAVDDNSPPAIMHRIVTLLHRSLKPREEVVRQIAADYQENALRLLDNLSARHGQEKIDMMTALRKASREAFSLFASAGQDMAILIEKLRGYMDTAHTADKLTRPALAQKLDAVAGLCQARLDSYKQDGQLGDGPETDSNNPLDDLSEIYRVKLFDAVRRPGDAAEAAEMMDSEVAVFVKRCLQGDAKHVRHTKVKMLEEPARDVDGALEVFLDGIINTLQEGNHGCGLVEAGNAVTVVSEDSDMTGMDGLD